MAHEHRFLVVLEPAEEGGFNVSVPALPEVVTFGEDEAHALAMAEDAIRLAIEYRREQGDEIPGEKRSEVREIMIAV